MIARQHLATAFVPGGEELRLYSHDRDFMILLKRDELMSTRMRGSEEALAVQTIARLGGKPAPRLLIGGYGMGFTLRAALAALDDTAQVTVAELVPEIVDWARGPMAELSAGCLDDPRVRLEFGDVADAIGATIASWDAILLDVDNGPDGLVRPANDRIYSPVGLAAAKRALRPGGVLAVWSAAPDAGFTRRLRSAGFQVEDVSISARANGKGPRHVIWFARRPS
ncbi:spermidine synthase [Novosphingobium sp. Gsoil 351]|uniref:spermidine synthase n=1 Tax=Novosphingobium sp. Gsoil 351 TaxID=2675225 RepID=UPI0012B4CA57|nr:spermidine synthase [Novosphingobium sp. Gsoil 351]QGN55429.1 spermidine synthase [Novosphingobium sp. Gsoil 351]